MREYKLRNSEKIKAGLADHYRRNAERIKARAKAYYAENKDHIRQRRLAYYAKTKQIQQEKNKKWQAKNPEKYKAIQRANCLNRVARKRNAPGKYRASDIHQLYATQNGTCNACHHDLESGYHVDHVVPLSRGGSNWPSNLQLLCPLCNYRKSSKTMEEFMMLRSLNNA